MNKDLFGNPVSDAAPRIIQLRLKSRRQYQKHKIKKLQQHKEWKLLNKDKVRKLDKAWRQKNRDKIKAYQQKYRQSGGAEKQRSYQKNRRIQHPEIYRNRALKSRYGTSLEDFNRRFSTQNFQCAICKTTKFCSKGPSQDHNHETKQLRGILCRACNTGIGNFKDSIAILHAAIAYLKKYQATEKICP